MRSQPYSNKCSLHNEERYHKHPEGGYLVFWLTVYIFFNIQGIYRGKGDRSSLDWGGFKTFTLNWGGVIKRLRFQKNYFHNFSVGWGLNLIFTRFRGEFKTLVIIRILLGRFLLIFLAESEKVAFLVTDINDFVIFVFLLIADTQGSGFVIILISTGIQPQGQRLKSVSSSNASSTTSAISCMSV